MDPQFYSTLRSINENNIKCEIIINEYIIISMIHVSNDFHKFSFFGDFRRVKSDVEVHLQKSDNYGIIDCLIDLVIFTILEMYMSIMCDQE